MNAVGFGLITSYGDKWMGDPAFLPVFDELNRRKVLVFLHTTGGALLPEPDPQYSSPVVEYNTDTSRAIANILINGSTNRTVDVHALRLFACRRRRALFGPTSRHRPCALSLPMRWPERPRQTPACTTCAAYYDVAQSTNPIQIQALKLFAGMSQIVFGADFPYSTIVDHVEALRKCGLSADELKAIDRVNSLRLLPQYRT